VTNLTTGVSDWEEGQAYDGPVAALQNQFVTLTADNVNVTATKPNNFIHTGSGNDAIDLSLFALGSGSGLSGSGTNVVDGGAGSNFIALGSAFNSSVDTVFIDTRAAVADTWSTMHSFHKGDAVTIYGVAPSAATLDWEDNQGTAGFTGLTPMPFTAGEASAGPRCRHRRRSPNPKLGARPAMPCEASIAQRAGRP